MRTMIHSLIISSIIIGSAGCAAYNPNDDLNRQAIALRRLASAVQGELMLSSLPPNAEDLLAAACWRDPALCRAFGNNKVFAKVVEGDVILLLCTSDGQWALIEDAACTPQPDFKAWEKGECPCKFTIDTLSLCY